MFRSGRSWSTCSIILLVKHEDHVLSDAQLLRQACDRCARQIDPPAPPPRARACSGDRRAGHGVDSRRRRPPAPSGGAAPRPPRQRGWAELPLQTKRSVGRHGAGGKPRGCAQPPYVCTRAYQKRGKVSGAAAENFHAGQLYPAHASAGFGSSMVSVSLPHAGEPCC